jgi:hypothetical protein
MYVLTSFSVLFRKRDSAIGTVTALRAGLPRNSASVPSMGQKCFASLRRPDQFWGPPSLLFNGYRRRFPRSRAPFPKCLHGLHNYNLPFFTEYSFTFFGRSSSFKRNIKNYIVMNAKSKTGCVRCHRYTNKLFYCAKFEIITMVTMKVADLRDVTPCSLT